MVGEINFNLLDQNAPQKTAQAFNLLGAYGEGQDQAVDRQMKLQNQQMNALGLMKAQQGMADDQAYRQAFRQNQGDMGKTVGSLTASGQIGPDQLMAIQKHQQEITKGQGENSDLFYKVARNAAAYVASLPDDHIQQGAINATLQTHKMFGQDPTATIEHLQSISPDQIRQEMTQAGVTLDKKLADIQMVNTGGQTVAVQKNPYAPNFNATTLQNTVSPNEQAQLTNGKIPTGYQPSGKNDGKLIPIPGGPADTGISPDVINSVKGMTGNDVLSALQPQAAAQVKALAEGRMQFPSGFALKSPYWQNMISLVSQYDPEFDMTNYNKRAQTAKNFSAGKQGDAVRAVNQTLGHMDELSTKIDQLNNSSGPLGTAGNYIANSEIGQAFTNNPAAGNFKETVQAVGSEVRKVIAASGGGYEAELKAWENSFPLNASKERQQEYLQTGLHLLNSAVGALDNQYQQGMGSKAKLTDLLSPAARVSLGKLTGQPVTNPQTGQGGIAPAGARAKLPDGSIVTSDGKGGWN